jgi:hypothetical protein
VRAEALIVLTIQVATGASAAGRAETTQTACGPASASPCQEDSRLGKAPPSTPTAKVSNADGDLWALNSADEVQLWWTPVLSTGERLVIFRARSAKGPWKKVADIDEASFPTTSVPYRDLVDATEHELFYRVIRRSGRSIQHSYALLRVPKYGASPP